MTQGALDKFRNSSGWTVSRRDCRGGGYRREWPHRHQHGAAAGGGLRDEQWRADGRCVAGSARRYPRSTDCDPQTGAMGADRPLRGSAAGFAGRFPFQSMAASPPWRTARARDLGGFDFRIQAAPAQDAAARFLRLPSQQAVARDLGFAGGELHLNIPSGRAARRRGTSRFRAWCAPGGVETAPAGGGRHAPSLCGAWRHPASRAAYGFARV